MASYKDFVARVMCGPDDSAVTKGTGYPVAPGRLLTAKHVLENLRVEDVLIRVDGLKTVQQCRATAIHRFESNTLDFAVIEFTPLQGVTVPGFLSSTAHEEGITYSSRGYPMAGLSVSDDGEKVDRAVNLKGNLYGKASADKIQELEEDAPCAAESWPGVSGAAVFVDGAEIAGILIAACDQHGGRRLEMLPMANILEDADFRDLCSFDFDRQRALEKAAAELQARVLRQLSKANDEMRLWLLEELKFKKYTPASSAAADLCHCLTRVCSPHNAVLSLNAVFILASRKDRGADANAVLQLLDVVTPLVLGAPGAGSIAHAPWGVLIDVAAADCTMLEACMAYVDGRNTEYRPSDGSKRPMGHLAVPAGPDCGLSEQSFSLQYIRAQLAQMFGCDLKTDGDEAENDRIIAALLKDQRDTTAPRSNYLIVPAEAHGVEQVVHQITSRFPALACLRLRPQDIDNIDYQRALRPLRELLQNRAELDDDLPRP